MKMKTKKIILLLSVIMLFALVACGKDKTSNEAGSDGNQTQTDTGDNGNTSEDNSGDDKGTNASDRQSRQLKKRRPIYYDYYADYYVEKTDIADVVYSYNQDTQQSDIMIGFYDGSLEEYKGNLEDVMNWVNESTFIAYVSDSGAGGLPGGLFGNDIEVSSSEKVTIAGFDSIKYTGTIVNSPFSDESWVCNAYGYTFIIDEIPYAVIGIVTTREQEQAQIDEMMTEVDAIAASIRTEE